MTETVHGIFSNSVSNFANFAQYSTYLDKLSRHPSKPDRKADFLGNKTNGLKPDSVSRYLDRSYKK